MSAHLEEVMNTYGEYCMRVAYLYVKDWAAAEEIVQDTFLAYYKQQKRFEGRSSLKTYLVKITIHKSHDYLRSWKRKMTHILPKKLVTPSVEQKKIHEEQQSKLCCSFRLNTGKYLFYIITMILKSVKSQSFYR